VSVKGDPGPSANTVFAGRYRIIGLLGEGDRKRTYLAEDTVVPRRVALALVKPTAGHADPEGTRREAQALAKAGTHDNVVTLYDWGIIDGTEYLVFDHMSGGTLREYLAKLRERGRPLPADEVARLGRQLARALAHVHKLGLVHRDVAPANVWLDERRVAHLGDFDSAVTEGEALDRLHLPPTTEAYAAPEEIAGEPFDHRCDLYSLGAVLYEALAGERPERGPRGAIARRLTVLRSDAPRALCDTICSLLSESPEERPENAESALAMLSPPRAHQPAEEGLLAWTETLPFPVASILWHYEGEPDPAVKVDYLLKFFEALAQFTATVLLSGCISDSDLTAANRSAWLGGDETRPLQLQFASFGTWTELSERLAETLTNLLETDSQARCQDMFASTDVDLVATLASAELAGIFRHARDRRNNWSGHGGIAGLHVQSERLRDLEDLLARVRTVLGWSFEPWTLVKPGSMTLTRGVFELTATILKGPNLAFRRKNFQLTQPLDAGRLYLLQNGSLRALALVPFLRVLASSTGQEACYFYSRLDGSAARWVSYHFQAEPELTAPDDELAALLANLAPRGRASGPGAVPSSVQQTRRARRSGTRTVWSLLEECVGQLDEPFRRSEVVGWFRQHHPDVNEATLAAHIQFATANTPNRAKNSPLGSRPPLVHRVDHGLYIRARR
jgi:serine/threonine protein kinase